MTTAFGDFVDLAGVIAAAAVALVGAYWANSYERQGKVRLAEARRTAYAALWEATGLATPTRIDFGRYEHALKEPERRRLHQLLTDWYYRGGHGMLLPEPTRSLYLNAKRNLVCKPEQLVPTGILRLLPPDIPEDARQGFLVIKQLSLLRTQMKADLAIYGLPYVATLAEHERAFLRYSKVNLTDKAWSAAILGRPDDPNRCITDAQVEVARAR